MTGTETDACTMTLNVAAPSSGLVVDPTSSNAEVTVPTTVTAVASATSTELTATVARVATTQTTILTASAAGVSNSFDQQVNSPPVINTQPVSQSVTLGSTASFSVTSTGTPTLTYAWQYLGGSGVWMSWAVGSGYNTASFTTLPTTANYNGLQIQVVVTDGNGLSTTSNPVTLTVNSPPVITTQPVSQSVNLGSTASFSVAATGTPTLTYQWQFSGNGTNWLNWVSTPGTYASMTTPAVPAVANGWKFRVVVTDGNGLSTTSNPVTLTVNSPPVITVPPVSQSVTLGSTATFSVTATGTPTLTYQWQFSGNGMNWLNWISTPGTFASMTTPIVPAVANGWKFRVVVTDGNGLSTTSNPVTLTVNATTPTLTINAASVSFGSVEVNTVATQSVTLTSTGTVAVTVNSATLTGTGFTVSGATFPITLTPGQTVTLNVQFAPTAAGAATGQMTITSNSSTNGTSVITLSGTGTSPEVDLSWDAPSSSADPIEGYNAYRAPSGSSMYTLLNSSIDTEATYVDNAVQSGQTYDYIVTSVDYSGVESTPSNTFTVTIP
jgi:hypothetical protein